MMLQIPLENGDEVIAAFPWHDFVLVVTQRGCVFKLGITYGGGTSERFEIQRID